MINNGYGLVYQSVMRNKNLSIEAKAIYAYFSSFAGNKNECYPPKKLILKDLGIAEKRYDNHFKKLLENGYIIKNRNANKGRFSNNIYLINIFPDMQNADMQNADMQNADMQNADMQNADMQNADMQNAGTNINSINNKNISAKADIQKGEPFCSSAEPVKPVKNEFEDAETAQSNTLTVKDQIKAQRQRYNAEQLKVIDQFFDVLKYTRKSCKIADSVILKSYQDWSKHEVQKVIYGLDKYINNPSLHDKNEKYVLGIIRNSTAAEINKDAFESKSNSQQVSKKPYIKPNRFINYEQRDWDFDELRKLERQLLDKEVMAD